jgi:hypothetical protein
MLPFFPDNNVYTQKENHQFEGIHTIYNNNILTSTMTIGSIITADTVAHVPFLESNLNI